MSRDYKKALQDDALALGVTGVTDTSLEKLSGADLAQALAAIRVATVAIDAAGTKTLGNDLNFTFEAAESTNTSAKLSGADLTWSAGN